MYKNILLTVITFSLFSFSWGDNTLNENIVNENVEIEYSENSDGTWEIYIDIQNDQFVEEVNMNDFGNKIMIAPIIK